MNLDLCKFNFTIISHIKIEVEITCENYCKTTLVAEMIKIHLDSLAICSMKMEIETVKWRLKCKI